MSDSVKYDHHALSDLFPMMTESEHQALVTDIKVNGLLQPLVTFEGKVIDGRNRLKACSEAGVEPRFVELPEGQDPLSFVVGTNFVRRHLSESQRALSAAKIQQHQVDREQAASQFKVTKTLVKAGETVLKNAIPALITAVEQDAIPVSVAAKLSSMPEDAQAEACTLKAKDLRGVIKRQARIKRNVRLVKATQRATEKLGHAVYSVLLADPPWKWEPWSENGMDRSAENHYPVLTLDALKAFPVPAADNAVLFLWVPGNMNEHGLEVLHAWGFEYRSQFVWVKNKAGTGFWNRSKHELLFVGVKGNMPAPEPSERVDSTIHADVGEHSEKPAIVNDMITRWYPDQAKIELFARQEREGWESHGNQLPDEEAAAAD